MEYILPMYLAINNPQTVVNEAQSRIGTYYAAGVSAQCANFVRFVFNKIGINLPSAQHPSDQYLIPYEPIGSGYANSFAGPEIGPAVKLRNICPGDIVMYSNTYGNWPRGVITHVGIYVGNGQIVHRPTSSGVVKTAALKYATIAEIRRPKQFLDDDNKPNPKPTPVFGSP